jgi:hypothetical protein
LQYFLFWIRPSVRQLILPAFDGQPAKRAIYAAEVNHDKADTNQKSWQEETFAILQR